MRQLIMAIRAAIFNFLILIPFLMSTFQSFAQAWNWVNTFGDLGTETIEGLIVNTASDFIISGTFSESFPLNGITLTSSGEKDVFIAAINANMETAWAISGGSNLNDELTSITKDASGNIICTGAFWLEATFEDETITTSGNPKGIFILKLNEEGEKLWLRQIDGADLKAATTVQSDAEDNIFISGYFDQELHLGDTIITANGSTDSFIAKYDADGQLIFARNIGYKGDTRAIAMALSNSGKIVLGGFYNDTTIIALDTLPANTTDRDVFIACLDSSGLPMWGRKAGGVHDDELTGIIIDEEENIFATGYLVGVMSLDEGISIQSSNGNADIYLLKYNIDGTPISARALGGELVQQTTDIAIFNQTILVSGFFQGDMDFDGINLSAEDNINGFIAGFDKNLFIKWAETIEGSGNVFANRIGVNTNMENTVLIGGSFSNTIQFNETIYPSNGSFDIFLSTLSMDITSVASPYNTKPYLKVFPNPSGEHVNIDTNLSHFDLAIMDKAGRLCLSDKNTTRVDISNLPSGVYLLHLQNEKTRISQAFVKL